MSARVRFSLRRMLAVARKEFIHLIRDPRMFGVVFVAPMVQLTVLGYAANFDVLDVPVMVVDYDHSAVSRAVTNRLDAGEAFELFGVTDSMERAEEAMDSQEVELVVVVPRGAQRGLKRGDAVEIPVWLNGTDTNRALSARGYVEAVLARVSSEVVGSTEEALLARLGFSTAAPGLTSGGSSPGLSGGARGGAIPAAAPVDTEEDPDDWLFTDTFSAPAARPYVPEIVLPRLVTSQGVPEPRTRIFYNPTLQSRWFMVPGVLAMVLTVITVLLSGMAVVKERENGTIEQLSVTPIEPIELIMGKLAPFVLVGLIDGLLVSLVAVFWFEVPFRGSVLDLSAMTGLYLVSTLGLGLLISTISKTQQQAMMSGMLFLLPNFLLAGVLYPASNMPDWAQTLSALLPLTYFIQMVRGVFLKGVGVAELQQEVLSLAGLAFIVLGIAIFRFRKRSA